MFELFRPGEILPDGHDEAALINKAFSSSSSIV
jgi:hypothetical protein